MFYVFYHWMFSDRSLKTGFTPFSVCALCFDAYKIISFSLKLRNYIGLYNNAYESFLLQDIVCPINVKNLVLSKICLKWYVQYFVHWFILFSSPRTHAICWVNLVYNPCPLHSIQSFFYFLFVHFLFILLYFLKFVPHVLDCFCIDIISLFAKSSTTSIIISIFSPLLDDVYVRSVVLSSPPPAPEYLRLALEILYLVFH